MEELFDLEEIIQECKALNNSLINFLQSKLEVQQLLHYIVEQRLEDVVNIRAL
jgi:hypothetical protein